MRYQCNLDPTFNRYNFIAQAIKDDKLDSSDVIPPRAQERDEQEQDTI